MHARTLPDLFEPFPENIFPAIFNLWNSIKIPSGKVKPRKEMVHFFSYESLRRAQVHIKIDLVHQNRDANKKADAER